MCLHLSCASRRPGDKRFAHRCARVGLAPSVPIERSRFRVFEPLYLFVFTHFPTESRFALFLDMF
ncbi:hypothetical protein BC360_10890 [Ensifer sp. LC163]|nr:hypothetical protein BC360_10890 [Ensifer sp. LC163]